MSKKKSIVLLIGACIILSGCSSHSYISQRADADHRIDGHRGEWTGKFQIPDKENFALAISNDKNYLYLAISSIDKSFQRRLAKDGLSIWLDVKGGKRQNLGIQFEGTSTGRRRHDINQRDPSNRKSLAYENLKLPDGDLTLIVIDKQAGKSLGPADLLGAANSADETLFIEYQIPFSMLGTNFDKKSKLGLGLESSSVRPSLSNHSEGMRRGGRGGMAAGMNQDQRGSGRRPGSPQSIGAGTKDIDLWMKIQLTNL